MVCVILEVEYVRWCACYNISHSVYTNTTTNHHYPVMLTFPWTTEVQEHPSLPTPLVLSKTKKRLSVCLLNAVIHALSNESWW